MSELPSGWAEASIGEIVCQFETIDPTQYPTREFRYIDIGSIDNTRQVIGEPKVFLGKNAPSRARRVVRKGDILFSTVRTYLRNIAIVPAELDGALTSTGIAVLRPSDGIDCEYLFRWVCGKPFIAAISEAQDGTMYPAVSDKDVAAAKVLVPPSAEQKRLVAKLNALMRRVSTARDELSRVPLLVSRYKSRVLEAAFSGELTQDWREQQSLLSPVEPRRAAQIRRKYLASGEHEFSPPYEVPSTWRWLRLPEIGELDRGKSRHRPRNDPRLFGGPYPFIQTGDVRAADRFLRAYSATYNATGLAQSRLWPVGTLCITIAANIAETAILGLEACFPDSVVGFIADDERTSADYVEFFLRTARADIAAFAPATAQKNINLDTLANVRVPMAPRAEQDEIVRRIEKAFAWIDKIGDEEGRAAELLSKLEEAIVQKALRGALVPQNSADEPASALLERIALRRDATSLVKKGKGSRRDAPLQLTL